MAIGLYEEWRDVPPHGHNGRPHVVRGVQRGAHLNCSLQSVLNRRLLPSHLFYLYVPVVSMSTNARQAYTCEAPSGMGTPKASVKYIRILSGRMPSRKGMTS